MVREWPVGVSFLLQCAAPGDQTPFFRLGSRAPTCCAISLARAWLFYNSYLITCWLGPGLTVFWVFLFSYGFCWTGGGSRYNFRAWSRAPIANTPPFSYLWTVCGFLSLNSQEIPISTVSLGLSFFVCFCFFWIFMPDTGEAHIQSWQASGWNNINKSWVSGMMA